MGAATYTATMSVAFEVGLVVLGALAIYLLDRALGRRDRPAERVRDPYADAQALAARRRAAEHVGRARVPVHATRGGASWS